MDRRTLRRLSLPQLVMALILVKGLLFLVLLPPWQGPDEPTRLEPAVIIARSNQYLPAMEPLRTYQEETLRSMRLFRSWDFYERQVPLPSAKTFEEANLPAGASMLYETPLAYLPAGLAIRWAGADTPLSMLYAARMAAFALSFFSILILWRISGSVFKNTQNAVCAMAPVLMYALHPQVSFLGASAHPDAVGFVLSSLVLALLILAAERSRVPGWSIHWIGPFLLALALAGASGYVIRKMLILVPFVVSCIPLVFASRLGARRPLELVSRMLLACMAVGFVFCALLYEYPELLGWRLLAFPQLAGVGQLAAVGLGGWVRYAGVLFATFWMALGSLVSKLGMGWLMVLAAWSLFTLSGWFRGLFPSIRGRVRALGMDAKGLAILFLWLAWVLVSVLTAYGPRTANPEGRYLLSALPTIVTLWIVGLRLQDEDGSRGWVRLWSGVVLLLNGVVLFEYLIPIYYL